MLLRVFAYLQSNDDGDEDIATTDVGGFADPLVAVSERSLRRLRSLAQEQANLHERPVRLVVFEQRRDLSVVHPNYKPARERRAQRA